MKGSYTVEAALLLPFLCMVLCAMIVITLGLYERVEQYGETTWNHLQEKRHNPEIVRVVRHVWE